MKGLWTLTWHEDREISPGVPDASYVMAGGKYETGWLELKAVDGKGTFNIGIEQSQHEWIKGHCEKIPVHFLIRTNDMVWLIPGASHFHFVKPVDVPLLQQLAIASAIKDDIRKMLYNNLRQLTFRGRNGV
ncbi:hypothetical protein UFOVP2_52 [uncultured Caudovirales phage]|uniref:Uncharacterized protein n=1 Tax=uncultured Caudovirales phage TaxID=2100421 RepID=A0A6J5KI83_9CAUD|nr:hypothetical protein UFOVP2_52 [uncultured Caudovirales phage]